MTLARLLHNLNPTLTNIYVNEWLRAHILSLDSVLPSGSDDVDSTCHPSTRALLSSCTAQTECRRGSRIFLEAKQASQQTPCRPPPLVCVFPGDHCSTVILCPIKATLRVTAPSPSLLQKASRSWTLFFIQVYS